MLGLPNHHTAQAPCPRMPPPASFLAPCYAQIAELLANAINHVLAEAENRIWHAHPVWFLEGNPVVGYSLLKDCVRLPFWSGQLFEEDSLHREGKFKSAEARYTSPRDVTLSDLRRWLTQAREIQWDDKNLIRRKGILERLREYT